MHPLLVTSDLKAQPRSPGIALHQGIQTKRIYHRESEHIRISHLPSIPDGLPFPRPCGNGASVGFHCCRLARLCALKTPCVKMCQFPLRLTLRDMCGVPILCYFCFFFSRLALASRAGRPHATNDNPAASQASLISFQSSSETLPSCLAGFGL